LFLIKISLLLGEIIDRQSPSEKRFFKRLSV